MENLKPTRQADKGNDLYSVMNIIQEKMFNGGLSYQYKNEKGFFETISTKKLKGINNIIDLNKNIFELAMATV